MKTTTTLLLSGLFLISPKIIHAQSTESNLSKEELYVQEQLKEKSLDGPSSIKSLGLQAAIEQGLRKNHLQKVRDYQLSLLDLNFEDDKESFWMPKLSLNLTTEEQRITTLTSGNSQTGETSKATVGTLSLGFDDYTLFNWGKDYLAYLNTKNTFFREKEKLNEQKRDLKHSIIISYFNLYQLFQIQDAAKDQLRHASFIYRLNKEKASVKKINVQQYYQARSEYLIAQRAYHEAKANTQIAAEQLAELLGDDVGTEYVLEDEVNYEKLRLSYNESLSLAKKHNPAVLDAKTSIENSIRSEEITRREDLPLPKISVKLGAYNHVFGNGQASTTFSTGTNNNDVEVVASINASWALTGKDGLLNRRKRELAEVNKILAYKQKDAYTRSAHSSIKQSYKKIQKFQNLIAILEANIPTLQKSFDAALENYLNKRTSYNDYHLALEELIEARKELEINKFLHTQEKILLAKAIGLEDFPGQNFEKLAKPVKR
ncbi:TolC family protein [Halobacteriovorax sp. GB3]|uniref:TolC family protein n=1 Tax=Halobacteriovorax sp. GB3 TaxID=2719615 RepID=UPI0023612D0B|nr:TolC family protein [Halobacteriovorax sp. GB3]MDD0853696.1 TolC family protein [Halobacteriovorax sp. GB3]